MKLEEIDFKGIVVISGYELSEVKELYFSGQESLECLWEIPDLMHPLELVEKSIEIINAFKREGIYTVILSNSSDLIMGIKYIGEKENVSDIKFVLYKNGDFQDFGMDIEEIFRDFNRSLDYLNEITG